MSAEQGHRDPFLESLTAYVLDQLPEESRIRTRAHLESGCQECAAELSALQEAFHLLPLALPQANLKSSVKQKIDTLLEAEATQQSEISTGRKLISHYKLLKRLGIGGMGEVYLAEDVKLNRTTALKIIKPEWVGDAERKKRFLREAVAAASLKHPGIATIYEIGEEEGTDYIAMEYVEGTTLSKIVAGKPLASDRVFRIGSQLADALAVAHEKGILHRDLKPENIQIGPDDSAKVLDFGLAKFLETRLQDDYMTTGNRVLGTIPYMSPEQVSGESLDVRSDLFSLGSILYEMATGKAPFTGDNAAETLGRILEEGPPKFPAEVPASLQKIILRCLEKDPDKRYQSASALTEDLRTMSVTEVRVAPAARESALSIAVLYFENLSEEKESDYFRAGMTEDIITELSKIKALEVRSRSQVVRYKDQELDIKEIGGELKVTYVLQGSIRKAGNRLRISAQLVDARTTASLWGERYDRDLRDVFEIQAEIAQKIASALQVHLTKAEKKQIGKKATSNMEAYDLYLRGREMIFRLTREGVDAAISYFNKAIETDARYALAYAGLAQAYSVRLSFYGGEETLADQAIENARKALGIDKDLAQAYAALGLAYFLKGVIRDAEESCRKAIQLNPQDAFALWISGRLAYRMQRFEEAAERFKRTIELLPEFYTAYADLARSYQNLGLTDRALDVRQVEVVAGERYIAHFPNEARAHIFLANAYATLGEPEKAKEAGSNALKLSPNDPVMMYNAACLYSQLNEQDLAIYWLKKSFELGRRDLEWVKRDTDLDNIRNHPEYLALIGEK